jgi:hypothetical protein
VPPRSLAFFKCRYQSSKCSEIPLCGRQGDRDSDCRGSGPQRRRPIGSLCWMPPGELASLAWRLHTFVLERFRELCVQRQNTYGVVRHGRRKQKENPRGSFLPAQFNSFAAAILILRIKTTQQVGYKVGGANTTSALAHDRTSIDRSAIVHFTLQSVRGVLPWP